jgi:predicted anti-sigma-YlaC factor YlaD
MAALREVRLEVKLDTTRAQETLRVIAKHAQACADELAALDAIAEQAEPDLFGGQQ